MPKNDNECGCQAAPQLIFPCSGAADVGEISDRAARRLTRRRSCTNVLFGGYQRTGERYS